MSALAVFLMLGLFFVLPVVMVLADMVLLGLKLTHVLKIRWRWFLPLPILTVLYFAWVYWMEHR